MEAAKASKFTIGIFLVTFCYFTFLTDASPGYLAGSGFLIVGMFVVSILIAFPLFFIQYQLPRLAPVLMLANTAATIALTSFVYMWLFPAQEAVSQAQKSKSIPFVVNCDEPLPEFTLGYQSNLNAA